VDVDDPAILWDMDTAEDYQELLAHVANNDRIMKRTKDTK
jgi:hypothetical protein